MTACEGAARCCHAQQGGLDNECKETLKTVPEDPGVLVYTDVGLIGLRYPLTGVDVCGSLEDSTVAGCLRPVFLSTAQTCILNNAGACSHPGGGAQGLCGLHANHKRTRLAENARLVCVTGHQQQVQGLGQEEAGLGSKAAGLWNALLLGCHVRPSPGCWLGEPEP